MARNVRTSRRPLLPEIQAPIFQAPIRRGRVRRGVGRGRRRYNAFVPSTYYYGFLTTKDVGSQGSYGLGFECTLASWFNDIVDNRMPYQYGVNRLRYVIGNRDYWTAWDSSIGQRLVLRRCFEIYRRIAGSADNPAPLAEYQVVLNEDELGVGGRILRSPDQGPDLIQVGMWYGLEITPSHVVAPEIGTLITANPQTDDFNQPQSYRLIAMHHLRTTPNRVLQQGEFAFQGMFRSQAVLQALHYARGE